MTMNNKEYYLKNKDNIKEYQLKNKEKKKEIDRLFYLNNKENIKERSRLYHLNNKDKIKEVKRLYRLNNKDNRKKYYLSNKEKIKKRDIIYRLNNKDKIKKYQLEYYLNNRNLLNAKAAKYRATKLNATPKFSNINKIKEVYKNCPKGYTVDHIVPLQGKNVCGLHVHWNLQYLTPLQNSSKSNKF